MANTMTRLLMGIIFIVGIVVVQVPAVPLAVAGDTKQPSKPTTQSPAGGQMSGTEQVGNNSRRNADTKPKNPATTKPQGK